ncbi:MAG: N-acetylmuramoyl-L-alanine amidase family protein [Thermosediminibacteraceae bacterium]|nr:N-acetylmuramoyl-L-alanine amidase family protein [Thermosediminibacteraceae bacterium]
MIRKIAIALLVVIFLQSTLYAAQNVKPIEVYINDKKIQSDPAPIIYKNRTMVPIRVICEHFNGTVNWDDKERKVTAVFGDKTVILKINNNTASVNQEPVLLDVPPIIVNNRTMVPIRFIAETLGAEVFWNNDLRRVDIIITLAPQILDFSYTTINKVPAVLIKGNAPLEYSIVGQKDNALAIDIKAELKTTKKSLDINDDYLKRVVAGNFTADPQVTRFVLEIKDGVSYNILKPDENSLAIAISNTLTAIDVEKEENNFIARLKTAFQATYNYFTLGSVEKGDYRLVVDISDAKLSASAPLIPENDYVKNIRMSQFTINPYVVRVVFDLKQKANFQVFQDESEIWVKFSSQEIPQNDNDNPTNDNEGDSGNPLKGKIIVVDPGHGGTDPGAIYSGIKEKDLNLDIALRLRRLLEEKGARVVMTRESDIYVDLYTRAGIANEVGADLFVSIHNNSSTNPSTSGTMTLYYPTPEKEAFAKILQKAVVETVGLPNLGIVQRPNLVVTRETKMPSALVECAFMSNGKDLALLQTESFRQKVAEGILKGILNYFSGR